MAEEFAKKLEALRLVPVVALDTAEHARPLGEALCGGGLPVAEITFRTAAAEESIRILRKSCPQMLVGAGTVINAEQAKRAVDAGAQFIVSPGLSRGVVEYAQSRGIPVTPGVCTPTEIMAALEYSLKILKFFPAKQYGGLKTLEAFASVFPGVRFMPTGGVSPENLLEYLACPAVIACGGTWMVKGALIREGRFGEIERLTAEAAALCANRKGAAL